MVLALRMSSEMVYSDAGVKMERELMSDGPVVAIQGGSLEEVHAEASSR